MAYPLPAVTPLNDLPALSPYLWEAATTLAAATVTTLGVLTAWDPGAMALPVPFYYQLLVAQALQESRWQCAAYRYEPNYDRLYVSSNLIPRAQNVSPYQRWSRSAAWLRQGPTIDEWFRSHPARAQERKDGREYDTIAQTRIAASYGALQCMYPTAVDEGFSGLPEDLAHAENVVWPLKHFVGLVQWAREKGWDEAGCLKIALARYNGGAYGNVSPTELDDYEYVQWVEHRFRQCWGRPCFPDVELPHGA